ncbi:putative caffeoyl-CoA O-methyltransferase [Helianthus annuus]|nr:putative caffeoyl-CoA O-methyltransferase [Helianthus annuus]
MRHCFLGYFFYNFSNTKSILISNFVLQSKCHGSFDFIFVDADKDNYLNYHKRLIDLVKVGGVIGYNNNLWNGSLVAPPDAPLRKLGITEISCQLPVGDGITLCRRIS